MDTRPVLENQNTGRRGRGRRGRGRGRGRGGGRARVNDAPNDNPDHGGRNRPGVGRVGERSSARVAARRAGGRVAERADGGGVAEIADGGAVAQLADGGELPSENDHHPAVGEIKNDDEDSDVYQRSSSTICI